MVYRHTDAAVSCEDRWVERFRVPVGSYKDSPEPDWL